MKNSLLLCITLSATHHRCNIVITYLWMPLHGNKGLLEQKFSSCSLIFCLKQKIICWTLPNIIMCIWQAPHRKLKDNSAVFWHRSLWLVWPIGKNLTGFRFGWNPNSCRFTGHFVLFNSRVQHHQLQPGGLFAKKAVKETMWDNGPLNNSLV